MSSLLARTRTFRTLALFLALLAAGAGAPRGARADDPAAPGRAQAALPTVIQWDQDQARRVLEALGLEVRIVTVVHANIGRVVSMSPPAGTLLSSVSKVTLQVGTQATAKVVVPECAGRPLSDALAMLEPLFACETVEMDAPGQPGGVVLALQPAAGQSQEFRGAMRIMVSRSGSVVPSVLGMTEAEARGAIEGLGLRVEVTFVDEPRLTPGRVATQDPSGGAATVPNGTVRLRVARAGAPGAGGGTPADRVRVPDLVSLPLDLALRVLAALGLVAEPTYQTVDAGGLYVVLSQGVLPQESVARGTRVPFTVSLPRTQGLGLVRVPAVVGMLETGAASILVGMGLRTTSVPRVSQLPPGTVLESQPAEGAEVAASALVTLFVAHPGMSAPPPTMVSVPDLVGQPMETAQQMVVNAGLQWGMLLDSLAPEAPVDVVTQQRPPARSRVAPGTSVTVYVPDTVRVPTLLGQQPAEVDRLLTEANLRQVRTSGPRTPDERAVGQAPPAGTRLSVGSQVAVQYASGNSGGGGGGGPGQPVIVPVFVGLGVQAAKTAGTSAGLSMSLRNIPVGSGIVPTVRTQSLAAGSRVAWGTQITLDFSGGPVGPPTPVTFAVPDMRGWTPGRAEQWAVARGVVPQQTSVTPVVPGVARVVGQTIPANGQPVGAGETLQIVIVNQP